MSYSISVIMPTARDDYSLMGLPNMHYLEPTLNSLEAQCFKDFEFIIVDALYDKRKIDLSKYSFPVKHLPVHPKHRYWLDRKRWAVCGTLNTALMNAEGELIVRVDDCSQFDREYLQRFWDTYETGKWAMAMHVRYLNGLPAVYDNKYREEGYEAKYSLKFEEGDRSEILDKLYGEGGLIRDSRFPVVERSGGKMIAPLDWMYGYSSFTLDAALKVNGFDELFDGDKSLEDVDFGSRLEMAGYKNMFQLDVKNQVIEHEHMPIPERLIKGGVKPIKCNYAIFKINRKYGTWRANTGALTENMVKQIVEESLKPPCSPKPNFYDSDCSGDLFWEWVDNPPQFDLKMQRYEELN